MYIRKQLRGFLEILQGDPADRGRPGRLLAEARAGLQLIDQSGMTWFPFELVPPCRWRNNETVAREIISWWIVLTSALDDPDGMSLIRSYLDLLDESSQQTLGLFLLNIFVIRETPGTSEEDVWLYAAEQSHSWRVGLQDSPTPDSQSEPPGCDVAHTAPLLWPQRPGKSAAGSASGARGTLALAGRAPEARLVASVKAYFRKNPSSWPQQIALLKVLAASGKRSAVQFLVSKANHGSSPTVADAAGNLVYRVADRQGLAPDDLVDRSIPNAELDELGLLRLDYGPRHFLAALQDSLKLQLMNASGKTIPALPKQNKADDPVKVGEAKQILAESREGIKQIKANWKHRLHDYMCIQKSWPIEDWRTYLLANQVLGRMLQRLVWMDGDGHLFRPSESGTLIDFANHEVKLEQGRVRLAHAILVGQEQATAWLKHGNDHKVEWLFNQMDQFMPPTWIIGSTDMTEINDLAGSEIDVLAFYGTLKRLGYSRGRLLEGQQFTSMTKIYARLGIMVEIEFTGAYAPISSGWSALKTLRFKRIGNSDRVPLNEVPPVLLAESYSHYQTLAMKGRNANPEWKLKPL